MESDTNSYIFFWEAVAEDAMTEVATTHAAVFCVQLFGIFVAVARFEVSPC